MAAVWRPASRRRRADTPLAARRQDRDPRAPWKQLARIANRPLTPPPRTGGSVRPCKYFLGTPPPPRVVVPPPARRPGLCRVNAHCARTRCHPSCQGRNAAVLQMAGAHGRVGASREHIVGPALPNGPAPHCSGARASFRSSSPLSPPPGLRCQRRFRSSFSALQPRRQSPVRELVRSLEFRA